MLALDVEKEIQEDFPGLLQELDKISDRSDCIEHIYARAYRDDLTDDAADQLAMDAYTIKLWRQHRMIYNFEPELFSELVLQAKNANEDDLIPAELLLNLPYPCFQVSGRPINLVIHDNKTMETVGHITTTGNFFAHIAKPGEIIDGVPCLNTLWETEDGPLAAYYLPLTGNLKESTEALMNFLVEMNPEEDLHPSTASSEIILPMMAAQIILYLQATNADIQSRPTAARKKKSGQKKPSTKPPKIVDVGIHVAAVIRSAHNRTETSQSREGTGSGTAKRPHSRRGHWHTYLVGPRSEEQKRVVKWIAPTFIHGDAKKQGTTVVPVKK